MREEDVVNMKEKPVGVWRGVVETVKCAYCFRTFRYNVWLENGQMRKEAECPLCRGKNVVL